MDVYKNRQLEKELSADPLPVNKEKK
jgi:hypothetical protein